MNELRRKIVLGAPLFMTGLLVGCGGGGDGAGTDSNSQADGRLMSQSVKAGTDQNLRVSLSPNTISFDDIWWNNKGGGDYFVPSSTPTIQAVINGKALYISLVEQVTQADNATVKHFRSLILRMQSDEAVAVNMVYSIDGTSNTAMMRVLKRTTDGGGIIKDISYSYKGATGTVKITSIATDKKTFTLAFNKVKFDPVTAPAIQPFLISGNTTLVIPTQDADWL